MLQYIYFFKVKTKCAFALPPFSPGNPVQKPLGMVMWPKGLSWVGRTTVSQRGRHHPAWVKSRHQMGTWSTWGEESPCSRSSTCRGLEPEQSEQTNHGLHCINQLFHWSAKMVTFLILLFQFIGWHSFKEELSFFPFSYQFSEQRVGVRRTNFTICIPHT